MQTLSRQPEEILSPQARRPPRQGCLEPWLWLSRFASSKGQNNRSSPYILIMPDSRPFRERSLCSAGNAHGRVLALAAASQYRGDGAMHKWRHARGSGGRDRHRRPTLRGVWPDSLGFSTQPSGSAPSARWPDPGRLAARDRDRDAAALGDLPAGWRPIRILISGRWPWTTPAGSMRHHRRHCPDRPG